MSKIKIIFIYVSLEVSNFFRRTKESIKTTMKRMKETIIKIIHKCKKGKKEDDTLK